MSRKLWVYALALWLVLTGVLAISNFQFQLSAFLMAVLAIVAGGLLAFDK